MPRHRTVRPEIAEQVTEMTACEKFHANAHVRLSAIGSQKLPQTKPFGTVAGFDSTNPELVNVRVIGNTRAQSYHMDFWEVDC